MVEKIRTPHSQKQSESPEEHERFRIADADFDNLISGILEGAGFTRKLRGDLATGCAVRVRGHVGFEGKSEHDDLLIAVALVLLGVSPVRVNRLTTSMWSYY